MRVGLKAVLSLVDDFDVVAEAANGSEALERAQATNPDVVLMDIGMPILNGYDACRQIREQPWGRDITIVACTGWGQEEDRRQSRQAEIDHHLIKPVDVLSLKKLLSTSLEVAVADRATPD